MSRFFSEKYNELTPYVPGEQPQNRKYIKLNTNESPFPPSEKAVKKAEEELRRLQLYPDPECGDLCRALAGVYGIKPEQTAFGNGSDEILNLAFMAFCDEEHPAVFPDITYGFYPVYAQLNRIPYKEIPLEPDLSVDVSRYIGIGRTVFLANPNAPTGIALPVSEIERIVKSNPDNVVVVDEAYVDFGGESCVGLIDRYDNLLVIQTFSKSRSMAGMRLGMAIGSEELIQDINTLRFSTNPYNINRIGLAAGVGALEDEEYTRMNIRATMETRAWTSEQLKKLGFQMTDSSANFIFARSDRIGGEELYLKLKERGILIRHFTIDRIKDYNRITIGLKSEMEALIENIREILEEII